MEKCICLEKGYWGKLICQLPLTAGTLINLTQMLSPWVISLEGSWLCPESSLPRCPHGGFPHPMRPSWRGLPTNLINGVVHPSTYLSRPHRSASPLVYFLYLSPCTMQVRYLLIMFIVYFLSQIKYNLHEAKDLFCFCPLQ